jgi:dihydroorotate dehydrogenase
LYRFFYWLILGRLPAEFAHRAMFALLRWWMWVPGVRALVAWWCAPRDPALHTTALGLDFAGPLGLAAGFDKDARGADALLALGFGFVEVGTVTAQPQPGNPKPRMFRLIRDAALVNRLGFNNRGAAAAEARLARKRRGVVGVNLGKTKVVPEEGAIADYVSSADRLGVLADYVVVNVSSPNTPGLRDLQSVEKLRPLLAAVRASLDRASAGRHIPLLVKIAPDLADDDIDAVGDLALELGLDGIIATNTTIARTGLVTPADEIAAAGAGGLSGRPLKERSLAVLRRLRARVGDRIVLVAVGGIETADDAWERIRAGATLVQAYTGFIYGGPLWPRTLQRRLVRLARRDGFARVQDGVGSG